MNRNILKSLEMRVARLERQSRKLNPTEIEKQIQEATHLSRVDPHLASVLVSSGSRHQDKIKVDLASFYASSLKPSQITMRLRDSVEIALKMLRGKAGFDLGAIVSSDGYIMDGHHRWSGAIIAYGRKAKVSAYQADLKGSMLIRVLNILTKGWFKIRNGNKGDGSISLYTYDNVKELLEEFVEVGITGKYPVSADEVNQALIKNFGSIDQGIEVLSSNVRYMNFDIAPFAPKRQDMPVIKSKQVSEAVEMLNKGEVLWTSPYPKDLDI